MTSIKRVLLRDHVNVCGVSGSDIQVERVPDLLLEWDAGALRVSRPGHDTAIVPESNIKALWPATVAAVAAAGGTTTAGTVGTPAAQRGAVAPRAK